MKDAIMAVPGHEEETAGARLCEGPGFPQVHDCELGRDYEVAYAAEFASLEEATKAALEYYGVIGE